MKVKNVYQDDEGNWHIDYGFIDLMGLAIRVYFGQLFLGICVGSFVLLLATLASGNSLPVKLNIAPSSDSIVPQESVGNELYN